MAIFSYNTFSTVAAALADGDTVIVTQNGALFTETGDAISQAAGSSSLTILGTVASGEGDAIDLNAGEAIDINIGASGFVGSNADNAIEVTARFVDLRNSGTIQGSTFAVSFASATGVTTTLDIENSGAIIGSIQATYAGTTSFFQLTNTGSIQTTGNNAIFVDDATTVTIFNAGLIVGVQNAIYANGSSVTIVNSGEIQGNVQDGGQGGILTFTNTGTVIGDVSGGSGNDTFDTRNGEITGSIYGGSGKDVYIIGDDYVDIYESAEGDTSTEDTVYSTGSYTLTHSIERLHLEGAGAIVGTGNGSANWISGSVANNVLAGRRGADVLFADGNGRDTLLGGRDDDTLYAEPGDDCLLNGGAGVDLVSLNTDAAMFVNLTAGTLALSSEGLHQLVSIERVRTGSGNDTLKGSAAAEELDGSSGNDEIGGGGGSDRLIGGAGVDTMTGGAQDDFFVFESTFYIGLTAGARDVITDFKITEVIVLTAIDAISGGANDFFTFVGTTALGGAGQLRYEKLVAENITVVEGDVTGDAVADFRLELTGLIDLAAVNFAL